MQTTRATSRRRFGTITLLVTALALGIQPALADGTAQALPFAQDWSNTGLITVSDDWTGVPGIIGHRGDGLTSVTNVDPQTVLADGTATPLDVNANQANPNTFATGGVAEFEIADPVVALQGSGTADAPFLLLNLDTTGLANITVAYNLRDVDGSADNSAQQVALHFRVGSSGDFTNVPAGYVADATTGPSLATLVTPINVVLPPAASNQPLVQVRVMTTDSTGSDEWVGIDGILISGSPGDVPPTVDGTTPADGAVDVPIDANLQVSFSEPVDVTVDAFDVTCSSSGAHPAAVSGGPSDFTLDPTVDFAQGETCTATVAADQVTDQDVDDPPDAMEADFVWSFTTFEPPPPSPMIIQEVDSDTPGADALEFVELYDGGIGATDLSGLVLVFYNGNGDTSYAAFDLDGFQTDGGGYFVVGNSGVAPAPSIVFADGTLMNGADAVALYSGDASGFPNGTAVTTFNLIDAIVYDTADADDAGLLVLLNAGQPQVDEAGGGDAAVQSSQRCPNGAGGARNTDAYLQNTPTPGATNACGIPLTIMQIQGAAHLSPYVGQLVSEVPGIVTAVAGNGFYLQDASGDADIATSDGIFVFTASSPTVAVGDSLAVTGTVADFRPGGSSSTNLTTTEITAPAITIVSSGNVLPAPTVIGNGGRVPPGMVIDDDAAGSVETGGSYDPTTDGIDFYESLEGMRVQVNNAVAVGPRNSFGEIPVVGDDGANAALRTPRGGIVIRANDFNPERIIVDDVLTPTPAMNVGDHFTTSVVGVMDYSFGNFKLLTTTALSVVPGGLAQEITAAPAAHQLAVAAFNVENLDPTDGAAKFDELAALIVDHLLSPDILAVEEIQDNNGPTNDSSTDASVTYGMLISAIQTAGGPTYDFRQIDPVDDQDGGEPGGNIRVGFLFRTDRGLTFIDRPGGTSTSSTTIVSGAQGPELSTSPGRIDPTNAAFTTSRKPLAGEFVFHGDRVFVVANHFNSKGGDQPLFGRFQPPTLFSEVQRLLQAQIVHDFVEDILAIDPQANVMVLGDLNDFEFSSPLNLLKGLILHDFVESLPAGERYTYVFDGNSQVLDHILSSEAVFQRPFAYDVVHVNSEFAAQASDHEPQVALVCVDATAPSLSVSLSPSVLWPANHTMRLVTATVAAADNADPTPSIELISVTSNEPDDGDNDGNTTGDIEIVNSFTFNLRAERSGSGIGRIYTVTYRATDECGNSVLVNTGVVVPLKRP